MWTPCWFYFISRVAQKFVSHTVEADTIAGTRKPCTAFPLFSQPSLLPPSRGPFSLPCCRHIWEIRLELGVYSLGVLGMFVLWPQCDN